MNKKKAAKRIYKVTLDSFRTDLNADKYAAATGARRAASYLSETDKVAALKLVAKHFGIGLDEPGPTGRKGAKTAKKKKVSKKVAKSVTAGKFKPTGGPGLPRKKRMGRPRKNPEPEVAVAAEVPAAPKKRRGRQPKAASVETAAPVRTPPEAPKRQARKSKDNDKLDQIGLISRGMIVVDHALEILRKANDLANGQLNVTGYQDIADTATAAVRALKPHVSALAHQDPPPPPVQGNGQAERPFDQALLEAAAHSAGVPLPGDDSVQ